VGRHILAVGGVGRIGEQGCLHKKKTAAGMKGYDKRQI